MDTVEGCTSDEQPPNSNPIQEEDDDVIFLVCHSDCECANGRVCCDICDTCTTKSVEMF